MSRFTPFGHTPTGILNHGAITVSVKVFTGLPAARRRILTGKHNLYPGHADAASLEIRADAPVFSMLSGNNGDNAGPFAFSMFNSAQTDGNYRFLGFAATSVSFMQIDTNTSQNANLGVKVAGLAMPMNVGSTTFNPGDIVCVRPPYKNELDRPKNSHSQGGYAQSDSPAVFYKYAADEIGPLITEDPDFEKRVLLWATVYEKAAAKYNTNANTLFQNAIALKGKLSEPQAELMQVMIDEFKKLLFSTSAGHIVGKALYHSTPGQPLQLALL